MDIPSLGDEKLRMDSFCATCRAVLRGKQRKFCSRICKNRDTNHRHQSYARQQQRGIERKAAMLEQHGGRCSHCGYARNAAALTWHHLDPAQKAFDLDLRSLSNRTQAAIDAELRKCILLCSNCHAELHFPQFNR
jgi:hypothetical protein